MYDYRGIDGTGTASSPATGSNQVSYTVRKLADGNCWMKDYLKLTLSTSHAYEVANFDGTTTSWTPNQTSTEDALNYAIIPATKVNLNGKWYYPWYAATAGQGTQNKISGDVTASICPKGWRLPSLANEPKPGTLFSSYGMTETDTTAAAKAMSLPMSYTATGYTYNNGNNLLSPTAAVLWTATSTYNTTYTNQVAFIYSIKPETGKVQPFEIKSDNLGSYKFNTMPIQCVAIP